MLSKERIEELREWAECDETFDATVVLALLYHIAEMEGDATAQALALKAAKAMQQAETERADANERDAERYRYIRQKSRCAPTISSADEFDASIDQAMRNL